MIKKLTVRLIVAVVIFVAFSHAINYCGPKFCVEKGHHTACLYKSPKPGKKCKDFDSAGLTDKEKQLIVEVHNRLRYKVASGKEKRGRPGPQPAAIDMQILAWDNELEMIAQRWANQCDFNHDDCRDVSRFAVGQNIAMHSYNVGMTDKKSEQLIKTMINMWYNEVKDYSNTNIKPFKFTMQTGHYTQLVWSNTNKIGCGVIKYNKWIYLVCNYGPSGNYMGANLYEPA